MKIVKFGLASGNKITSALLQNLTIPMAVFKRESIISSNILTYRNVVDTIYCGRATTKDNSSYVNFFTNLTTCQLFMNKFERYLIDVRYNF